MLLTKSPTLDLDATLPSSLAVVDAPDDLDFEAVMELIMSKYTVELVDRHVAALRKICKVCQNGFLLKHLDHIVELLKLVVQRFAGGQAEFAVPICEITRVASQPFVSCKASDMITYGHFLPSFVKVLVSVLEHALPPSEADVAAAASDDPNDRYALEERITMNARIRIEVAHTLACWSRFGLDDDTVELRPHQPLIQAVADSGTPNLRILRQSQVMDALSATFRVEDSPEAIVITLGAIRDMSLYRPLARQITNSGLVSNLVHVIRVNLLGSDVLLVAAEVLWNVLELDWEGAAEALGQEEVIECFRDFMDAVLSRGYRFKDKIFRNDMTVLLMYISKRVENRHLFASTGLMALLLSHAVGEARRKELLQDGVFRDLLHRKSISSFGTDGNGEGVNRLASVALTNSQEDMEFRMLLWGTLARCCSDPQCAEVAVHCGFVPSLLAVLDVQETLHEQRQWSTEQKRKVQLEALSSLFQVVQHVPKAFVEAKGNSVVLQLLQGTRSREVQRNCLNLLQVAVRMGPEFAEELGKLGAVGLLIELFADKENSMSSRQLCASVLAGLCQDNADNRREFRKREGVESIRAEVVYRPDETTDNHLFFTLCVVDCVWCAIVGTKKNEVRFLDEGGLFALLDVLEVAPLLLKRQIIGCLSDLMRYRKAAKLFVQWNSQITMKGGLKILLELWQSEQTAAVSTGKDGVIRDLARPLNPQDWIIDPGDTQSRENNVSMQCASECSMQSSRASLKIRSARQFADAAGASTLTNNPRGILPTHGNMAVYNATKAATSAKPAFGKSLIEHQDSRCKIYAALKCIGFECQETLTVAEKQQMELVQLYPAAVELETWIQVQQNLEAMGVKPIVADMRWMEDSIAERRDLAESVQNVQRNLAIELKEDEMLSLQRFYDDIRGRAPFRRGSLGKDDSDGAWQSLQSTGLDDGGFSSGDGD